jgi:hypothetical protein
MPRKQSMLYKTLQRYASTISRNVGSGHWLVKRFFLSAADPTWLLLSLLPELHSQSVEQTDKQITLFDAQVAE